jgi:hypothetical protein
MGDFAKGCQVDQGYIACPKEYKGVWKQREQLPSVASCKRTKAMKRSSGADAEDAGSSRRSCRAGALIQW